MTFGEEMKSGDKTLIALIAFLLVSSLVSLVSKVFFFYFSIADQARNLQEQVAEIEMHLKDVPDESAEHAFIEDEILEIREKTERIISQEDAKSRLHWWSDILFPVIMLLFLVYLVTAKRRTESGRNGD